MGGKIFVLNGVDELTELTQTQYSDEDFFQGLIERHPSILAGDQIDPDNPRRWIFVSREMGVPSEHEGGAQWFLDHLFIDQDAIPTFIEVKRSTDTRIRREVVAQMLDYAANGIQYWPVELIRESYEKNSADGSATALADIGVGSESEDAFWQSVSVNLRAGRVRLIFAADIIPPSLRRIIEYLNGQMIDTEVLGLEIKQFLSSDGLTTTLVPDLIGKTVSAAQTKRTGSRAWDRERFFEDAARNGDEVAQVCGNLLEVFESLGCSIGWGKGKNHGSFVPEYQGKQRHLFCTVYNYDSGSFVEMSFQHMKPPFNELAYRLKLRSALEEIPGVQIPDDKLDKRPSFPASLLANEKNFALFTDVLKMYIADIKASEQPD
ncbi:hypothetical protein ACH6CV_16420 [Bacillota bacterium Meth-B3]